MDTAYISAITGLVGAAIGSASSIVTIIVQSRLKDRRDRAKQVIELSLAEYTQHIEVAKKSGAPVLPIGSYVYNSDLVLRSLEEGSFGPIKMKELAELNDKMFKAIDEIEKDRGKPGIF